MWQECFFVWEGTHKDSTLRRHVNYRHNDDATWHHFSGMHII
jgi:hypothetical protein